VYVGAGGTLVLDSCTFHDNESLEEGSSIYTSSDSGLLLQETIITSGRGGVPVWLGGHLTAPPRCCDIFGNVGGDWVDELEGFDERFGNLNLDPLFMDAELLDFGLQEGSPCLPEHEMNQCGFIGSEPYQGEVGIDPGDGQSEETADQIPQLHALYQNYPNPFNPQTRIVFDLPRDEQVKLTIYSVDGRKVIDLVDGPRPAGRHIVTWRGQDAQGRRLASGVFFYRFEAGHEKFVRKMVLLK
jgi:hypothetical protein